MINQRKQMGKEACFKVKEKPWFAFSYYSVTFAKPSCKYYRQEGFALKNAVH
jgi:hypothetical protein